MRGALAAIHGSWLTTRRMWDRLGAYRDWPCGADSELYIRALAHPEIRVTAISEPLILRRCHASQLTRTAGLGTPARTDALRQTEQTWHAYQSGAPIDRVEPVCSDARAVHARRAGVLVVMPTIPERASTARRVIESMLAQGVDMRVYLQGHDAILDGWPRTRRVDYIEGPRRGPLIRYSVSDEHHRYVLTLDDDIAYPNDYVSTTVGHLQRLGPGHAVGWHGSRWPRGSTAYVDRDLVSYAAGLDRDRRVTMVGSGVLGLHASDWQRLVQLDRPDVYEREDDVWVSSRLAALGVTCIRPPSAAGWIGETAAGQHGLWSAAVADSFASRDAVMRCAIEETGWSL